MAGTKEGGAKQLQLTKQSMDLIFMHELVLPVVKLDAQVDFMLIVI
jgi:hypothetical protein